MSKTFLTTLALSLSLSSLSLSVTLFENGEPRAALVLPDQALPAERLAAEELQYHLQRASGAKLPILSEQDAAKHSGAKVYLGNTRALAAAGLNTSRPEWMEWDRTKYPWHGKVIGEHLYFYGVDGEESPFHPGGIERHTDAYDRQPTGTLFAVYDFLEKQCGVRWIWPGTSGEVIPSRTTLTVDEYEQSGVPRFINSEWRSWSVHHRHTNSGFSGKDSLHRFLREQRRWLLRQRFRQLSPLIGFEGYFNYSKAHFDIPELAAMTPDGKRGIYYTYPSAAAQKRIGWSRVAMCVSHPAQPENYVETWRRVRGSNSPKNRTFNQQIVGINEADIPGYCVCPGCRAWDQNDPRFASHPYWNGTAPTPKTTMEMWTVMRATEPTTPPVTNRYARFWLACLDEVRKTDPNGKIWANAYTNYARPPEGMKLNENILVRQVGWPYLGWTKEATARVIEEWDGWRATGAGLLLRPNTTFTGHNLPVFYAREFAAAFSHAAANGLEGTDLDTLTGQWAVQGPTLYTIARMHVEPERPVEEILTEFYSAFGPAQAEVTAYFEHWAEVSSRLDDATRLRYRAEMQESHSTYGTPRINRLLLAAKQFPPEVMQRGRELLEQAKTAAANDPAAKERVHLLDIGLQDSELTLAAVALYHTYAQNPTDIRHRAALDQAIAALHAHRRKHETVTRQNLNFIASEERGLWHHVSLQNLRKKIDETAIDAD